MCGIAGILDERGAPLDLARTMAATLEHRGPDGSGEHGDGPIALAMRRLAIMDPAHGDQPLRSESGDVVVVFNGEIYNQLELREWLESRGHSLRSGSDGEVLPHLYEELGPDFLERLNGIFAIALWDSGRERLLLARDRFGVKPLYWARRGSRLYFASEQKAILASEDVGRELDAVALDQFLTFRFVPSPRTLLREVRKLPPGGRIVASGGELAQDRFWSGAGRADRRDRGQLVAEYSEAFERAVLRQTMSDRPIGVMLSGGVDSGAITSVLSRHSTDVRTFTVGFAGAGEEANEIPLARETADMFGASHEALVLTPQEYLAGLEDSLHSLDEPVGSTSALAVRFVCSMMSPDVPVALCGQGADEPQGGYWRHLGAQNAARLRALPGSSAVARTLARRINRVRLRRGLESVATSSDLELLMAAYFLLDPGSRDRLYSASLRERIRGEPGSETVVEEIRSQVGDLDPLAQMLHVDTRLWLADELLLIADKLSMAVSVELRVPFLDNDLMELAESIHSGQKVRGLTRKSLHKQAMLNWVPREIAHRRERGWATPMGAWLRDELRPLLDQALLSGDGICRQLFEESALRAMVEAHRRGEADRTRELFCLLSLGLWAERVGAVV